MPMSRQSCAETACDHGAGALFSMTVCPA
jgi:hypothetical protein